MTLPNNPTFDFKLSGVSGDLTFGKGGPRIASDGANLQMLTADGQPGNIIANQAAFTAVGIGTGSAYYPLDIWGNIHISNTSTTTSGILFPDGTFQTTASFYTPSYGNPSTIQFAGDANTFSGDSSNLTWDSENLALNASNINVAGLITASNVSSDIFSGNLLFISSNASIVSDLTVGGNLHVDGTVTFGNLEVAQDLVVRSLTSNTFVQAGTFMLANSIASNTTIQSAGIATVNQLISNANIYGANLNIAAAAQVSSLVSNTNITGATIVSTGLTNVNQLISNTGITSASLNTTGIATVNQLISNANIYGANLNIAGISQINSLNVNTATTTASLNVGAGGAIVSSLISNSDIYGGNLNISGTARISNVYSNGFTQTAGITTTNSLISNTNIYSASINTSALAQVNSLNVNTATSTASLNVGAGGAIVGSLISNSAVQAAGQVTAQTMVSNTTISAGGLVSGALIRSNGFVEGVTLKTSDLALVNSLQVNTAASTNTLNVITNAVVQTITSNTTIQSAGAALFQSINSNTSVTAQGINAINGISGNTVIANVTMSTADLNSSGWVRFTNTTVSDSTSTGALVVTGGVGIGGNLNVGGQQSTFAGNVRINGNLFVTGNSTIINSNTISVLGPTIEVGSDSANNPPLTSNDGYDRGVLMHYFIVNDNHAFMGLQNSTGKFVYLNNVQPGVTNVVNPFESVSGYVYGAAQFGDLTLSNVTISSNTANGALVVAGGAGIGGALNVGDQIATTSRGRFGQDLLANQLNSNAAISAVGTITGSSMHANNEISGTNISVTNRVSGDLIAANTSVTSAGITALNTITGNILVGNLAVVTTNVQATTLVSAQNIVSNSSIVTTSLVAGGVVQVNSLNSNVNVSANDISAVNKVSANIIQANTAVIASNVTVTDTLQANLIIGNLSVTSPFVTASNLLTGGAIISNSNITTTNLTAGNLILAKSIISNTYVSGLSGFFSSQMISGYVVSGGDILAVGKIVGDYIQSNTSISASNNMVAGDSVTAKFFFANVDAQINGTTYSGTIQSNGSITSGGLIISNTIVSNATIHVADDAFVGTLTSNGNIQTADSVIANYLYANLGVQSHGSVSAQSIYSNTYIQAATFIEANILYGNNVIQTPGTVISNQLQANTNIDAGGTVTAGQLVSNNYIGGGNLVVRDTATVGNLIVNTNIYTSNLVVSNITRFNVATVDTSLTVGTYVLAQQLIANVNVGIGTATVRYPLDVYGNIHIGNTSTISGILFSDGSFQDTAAKNTPSYGNQYTIQFAGAANTFSGNSSALFWDDGNLSLVSNNSTIINNIKLGGNLQGSNTSIISGKTGTFIGGLGGFGAVNAGVQDWTNYQPNTVALFVGNVNAAAQINVHNDSNGASATTDIVATADNGNASDTYIDLGIAGSGYTQTGLVNANDGYLLVHGNTATGGGNLILSTLTAKSIVFSTNGQSVTNQIASFNHGQGLTISSNVQSLTPLDGALIVQGGVGINGNLNVAGNITSLSGNIQVITGNSATFFGDVYGFGALYAGIASGYSYQPNTITQLSANINDYAQLNLQNIHPGTAASGDMVITADNGNADDTYIDLGINNSGFDQGTIDRANDGFLYVSGNSITGGGNLVLGTLANNDIVFSQGGADLANEVARFAYGQGLKIDTNVNSSDTTSGSLTTNGGIGIAQDAWIGGLLNVATGATVDGGASITGQSIFIGNVAGANYLALFQGGSGGDQFGIGVSQTAGDGVANDVLNSTLTGYAPYNLSASEIHFNIPSSQQGALNILSNGNVQVALDLDVLGMLNVTSAAAFQTNITVGSDSTFNSNLTVLGSLNANIAVLGNLSVTNGLSAGYASIGSFDQINSRGFANVQILQSNGYVSGNTWVVDGNVLTSTSTFQQVVDAWPAASFRTAHYLLQVTNTVTSSYQASQIMLIHDGTDVYLTEYADLVTNGQLGAWEADISSGLVELLFTPSTSQNMAIKVVRTTIDI